jgi:GNAT superfamily N-acetyltransferase
MSLAASERRRIEPLGEPHDRRSFTCGVEGLDSYLKTQASQDMRRKSAAVFVLAPEDSPATILGFFTLSAFAVDQRAIPDQAKKNLPRYPLIGAALIGRLAVGSAHQGRGIGAILLAEALRKAYENADIVGSSMVVVDALDEHAASLYEHRAFLKLPDSMRLILPMATIGELLT